MLERMASDAGYTRGAPYHRCKDKRELILAMAEWVLETWMREAGRLAEQESAPVAAL